MSILQRVVGQSSPTINDLISLTDPSFDLSGCSSRFRMRLAGKGGTPAVDDSETVTGTTGPPNSTAATVYTPSAAFQALTSGLYEFWHTVTLSGGGAQQDTPEQLLYLSQHAQMPGDLCSIGDVKVAFEPVNQNTSRDARIAGLITAASLMFNQQLDRELVPQSTGLTRRFRVSYQGDDYGAGQEIDLAPYDLRSASVVVLHPESSTPTTLIQDVDYILEPVNEPDGGYTRIKLSDYLVYTSSFSLRFGYANLDVTGNWGLWTTDIVPAYVREACVDTVRSWMRQNPAAYAYSEQKDPGTVAPAPPATFSIPPGAWRKVQTLKRMWL